MGNCMRRSSKEEKNLHSKILKSKHDKYFTFTPFDESLLSAPNISQVILETMLSEVSAAKSRFQDLLPSALPQEQTLQKLIVEVQKGFNFHKRSCSAYLLTYISISLEPGGPSFDTPRTREELPSWFFILEIMHNISSFTSLKFTAFKQSSSLNRAEFASASIPLDQLSDQRVFQKWIRLKFPNKKHKHPRLLIRVQWVFDESLLLKTLIDDSSQQIQRLEQDLLGLELSIN